MRKYAFFFLGLIVLGFLSCKQEENCDDIDCENPVNPLYIELIDQQTNINVFAAGILNDSSQLVIVNSDVESQKYKLLKESYLLELPDITKELGPNAYQIIIRNDYIVSFQLDMQSKTEEDCCETKYVRKFRLSSLPYDFNKEAILARIYINLE